MRHAAMLWGNVKAVGQNSSQPIQVTGLTLLSTGWTLVSGLYEYDLANVNITAGSIVEVVPSRHDIATVQAAQIMPEADVTAGYVKLYSKNAPAADIDITINIHTGLSTTPAKGFFVATAADGIDGEDGIDGDSSYVYIAYASDDTGTDFTTTFDPALDYIAILATDTEIPSPAVGDFAGLWKNLGGSGSEYSWNVNSSQQIIGYLTEPANIAVNVDGTGSVSESVAAGDVVVTAINANGETTPADVPAFDVLTDSTQAVISWDDVDGATAYRVYDAATGNYTETTSLNIDYLTFSPATAGSVPTENTAAIYQTPTEIENGDTVDIVGEGIDVETKEDEGDGTRKEVKLIKQQSDWDEEDTNSPNFIKGKPTISPGVDNFIDLTDTPSVYTGQAGKIPIVNATEDGLIFVDICTILNVCSSGGSVTEEIELEQEAQESVCKVPYIANDGISFKLGDFVRGF